MPQNKNTIKELEKFFKEHESEWKDIKSIKLYTHETIVDVKLFVESHLATIKSQSDNPFFKPYLQRLIDFKEVLLKKEKNDNCFRPEDERI